MNVWNNYDYYYYTLCSKKSDAEIQITITTAYLIRIKYPLIYKQNTYG